MNPKDQFCLEGITIDYTFQGPHAGKFEFKNASALHACGCGGIHKEEKQE